MPTNRQDKTFLFGFWNYGTMQTAGVNHIDMWKDLCMNVAMMPYYRNDEELENELPKLMDELHSKGMKIILKFNDTDAFFLRAHGKEEFTRHFMEKYEKYGRHPAVMGFYPGEEPGEEIIDAYTETVRLMVELAPELRPFIVLGSTKYMDRIGQTGISLAGFDNYEQMEPEEHCVDASFRYYCEQDKSCKCCGTDYVVTLLSSGHYRFRAPSEFDYIWQINVAAASGATGVFWFRLYDKLVAADYRGSPIDEYGQPNGESYRGLKRAQKRFLIHHGEILMKLFHQKTFHITRRYGGYEGFPTEGYCGVRRAYSSDTFFGYYDKQPTPGIVSFFKDADGNAYVAVVNNTPNEPGSITLCFDETVKRVRDIYYNGNEMGNVFVRKQNDTECHEHEIWLAPGQMELFRLDY